MILISHSPDTCQTEGTRSDDGYAVAVQADGKIVVAGDSYFTGSKVGFAVLRYLGDSASR
jgi:hypothetical protein